MTDKIPEGFTPIEPPPLKVTTPEDIKEMDPVYKEIQDGDIIPGTTREQSQRIFDEKRGLKTPPK